MKKLIAIAHLLGLVTLPGLIVHADTQSSTEELKRRVQERSQKIAEYRSLLDDPDRAVRLAALDVMLQSDDTAMRTLAYESGFNVTVHTPPDFIPIHPKPTPSIFAWIFGVEGVTGNRASFVRRRIRKKQNNRDSVCDNHAP